MIRFTNCQAREQVELLHSDMATKILDFELIPILPSLPRITYKVCLMGKNNVREDTPLEGAEM